MLYVIYVALILLHSFISHWFFKSECWKGFFKFCKCLNIFFMHSLVILSLSFDECLYVINSYVIVAYFICIKIAELVLVV